MISQKLLIVDDEPINIDILEEVLGDAGYKTVSAPDGEAAWKQLLDHPDISVILLDRMMPKLDGMQFMARLHKERRFCHIPVIMQTAASSSHEILEGLKAGVFYYLTKPFDQDVILNVVKAAIENTRTTRQHTNASMSPLEQVLEMITSCEFSFRSMEEAESICHYAARMFPDPARVIIGLCELAYNAIEHGNLGINFEEKSRLIAEGRLQDEINSRLLHPDYQHRLASLTVKIQPGLTEAIIRDMGTGFDHSLFVEIDPLKITQLNGRGIAIARFMSFDGIEYHHGGTSVRCWCERDPGEGARLQNQASAA